MPPDTMQTMIQEEARRMRAMRRLIALILVYTLVATLAAMPVAASSTSAGGASAVFCDPGVSGAQPQVQGRGGKLREPDNAQVHRDLPASAKGRATSSFSATVPVYFHVVTDGDAGDLSAKQISSQITVLNRTFGGREGGVTSGFTFELAGVTRTDDAVWYASRSGGAEHDMKKSLKQGGDDALNVYSTSGGAYLGWAYLPEITDTAQAYLDGIVIDWRTVPGASDAYEGAYDRGETLTHEAGHWLNLEHTFYGACNRTGDFVDDTPAQKTPSFGCPIGKDTCPAPGTDPIHNYMDYSYDTCYTEFTAGQAQRMHDSWLLYRAS
ncbi:MAG: metalloprotease [Chloroflexota bacterium]|nr:metalloprotease [Chloroflexota bacterium]